MMTREKHLSPVSFLLILSICLALVLTGCSRVPIEAGRDEPGNTREGSSPEPEETEKGKPVPTEPAARSQTYTLRVEFFLDEALPYEEGDKVNAFSIYKVTEDGETLVYTFDKAEYLAYYEKLQENYAVIEDFPGLEGSLVFYFEDDMYGNYSILVIGEENGSFIEKFYDFAYDYKLEDIDGDGSTEILNSISNGGGFVSWWMGFYKANTAGPDGRYAPSYDMTRMHYTKLKEDAEARFNENRNVDTFQKLIEACIYLGDSDQVQQLLMDNEDIAREVNDKSEWAEEVPYTSYADFSAYKAICYDDLWDEVFPDIPGNVQDSPAAVVPGTGLSENQYLEYFNHHHTHEVVKYCLIEDLDRDGWEEAVVVVCNSYDEIGGFYILRNKDGLIEQIDDLAGTESGYGIENVELVRMAGADRTCIHVEVTNWASLYGFSLYELRDDEIQMLCISASATGAGNDGLYEVDDDGLYDGYYQSRWSYDTFYYSIITTYRWRDGTFVPDTCNMDLPEYPESIEETITQYLALSILALDNCPEADERLSRLCPGNPGTVPDFNQYALYEAVLNEIMEFDDGLSIKASQKGDSATASISYTDRDETRNGYTFHLVHRDYGWSIENID